MRYTIRRVSIRSALKFGLLLGWLLALLPSLGLAALAVLGLRSLSDALGQVSTYDINVLGQLIASIDVLGLLGLSDDASRVEELVSLGWGLFGLLALGLTLLGGLVVAVTGVLLGLCYNLLAAISGGLAVELREAP
jgi:hypothetical protein